MRRVREKPLNEQMKDRVDQKVDRADYEGDVKSITLTGSTLLNLAILGGRVRGGGMPSGILMEVFGPSGCGKTVLLSEIAGNVQRAGGESIFNDPEARLNPQFAKLFGLRFDTLTYKAPDTVLQVFKAVRDWEPANSNVVNGIFADSLAALSTDLEMENKDGDKMGMRRAKEFSEELRKTCRILKQKNYLMVCSNQVRVNVNAGPYGQKYISPGGEAVGFYSSVRLRATKPEKIKSKATIDGKKVERVVGVRVEFEVFKSSVWKPYRTAPVTILFDYGIDDIAENLQFVKDYSDNNTYTIGGRSLSNIKEKAINIIEDEGLEDELRNEVIDLWECIESKFDSERKKKRR